MRQVSTKTSSLFLQQWCTDNKWLFVVMTSSDHLIDFRGEVIRFDSLPQTTCSIYFFQRAFPSCIRRVKILKAFFLLTCLELDTKPSISTNAA